MDVKIIAEEETHLMISQDNRFAIVERRNNLVYSCHPGKRDGLPLDRLSEVATLLDESDWTNEPTARAMLAEIVARGRQISQTLR